MTNTKRAELHTVKITEVLAWPNLNPRRDFNKPGLEELAASIKEKGLLQPVGVAPAGLKKAGVKYWLFHGERRLRACKLAGLKTIDVLVRDVDEATAHRLAGIENLDRDDLTAIEEATWLSRELELTGVTQAELAAGLGRSQAWVANRVRLLALPKPIQTLIHKGVVAPAMVRDTLLRFLKLEKRADQSKLWKAIAAEIKRAAKEASPVLLAELERSVSKALRTAGAIEVRDGYQYGKTNMGFNLGKGRFEAFKKEHGGRCVQSADDWRGETFYTFAATEWKALVASEEARIRSTRTTAGVSKKKLENPKLGPTKEPVDYHKLKERFGYENVILFDSIVDPSKIEPGNVAAVKVRRFEGTKDKEGVELVYVGPNVRALRGARTRRATPIRDEVTKKVQTARMDKAAKLPIGAVLLGLLEFAVGTNHNGTLKGLIEAELGREVELSRWGPGKELQELKISNKSLRRIAAGLASVAGKDSWKLEGDVDKAVDRRVTRDTATARKAWIDEHAPKGAK